MRSLDLLRGAGCPVPEVTSLLGRMVFSPIPGVGSILYIDASWEPVPSFSQVECLMCGKGIEPQTFLGCEPKTF